MSKIAAEALALARETLEGLLVDAEAAPERRGAIRWRNVPAPGRREVDPWLYEGTAGVALVLCLGHEVTGEPRYLRAAQAGALAVDSRPPGARGAYPGLYLGEAGLAALMLRLHRVSGEPEWLERACRRAAWGAERPPRWTELLYGAAGLGLVLLDLAAATGAPEWVARAERQARFLAQSAVPAAPGEAGAKWRWTPKDARERTTFYPGLAHGAAGVALFLLELARWRPDQGWDALGRRGLSWLEATAARSGGKANWPSLEGEPARRVQWCHGAPGIGLVLSRAFRLTQERRWLELARAAAATTVAAGDLRRTPCLCHGLAGSLELLIELAACDGDRWRKEAHRLAEGLAPHRRPDRDVLRWASDEPRVIRPALATGSAGVAYALLRLAAAPRIGLPLLGPAGPSS